MAMTVWLLVQSPVALAFAADPLALPARQSAKAHSALMTDVASVGQRLVAVGERGIILYTDDSGISWKQALVPVSVNLTAVFFTDTSRGWAVGHAGVILFTGDGGRTWVKQFDGTIGNLQLIASAEQRVAQAQVALGDATGQAKTAAEKQLNLAQDVLGDAQAGARFGPSRPLLGVFFKNPREGYAVGSFGQIFHTKDGGAHWLYIGERLTNPENLHYNALLQAASGKLILTGEGGRVHLSDDDGRTWRQHDTGYKGQLFGALALQGASGETLLAYGFAGHIFRSRDSGASWTDIGSELGKTIVDGIALENGGACLATSDGQLLRSDGESMPFKAVSVNPALPVAAIAGLPNGSIALAGMRGVRIVSLTTRTN